MIENPAIVLGTSSTNTLGVIRALGRRRIPVHYATTDTHDSSTNKSKYVSSLRILKNWDASSLVNYFDSFISLHNVENRKIVVFPTNDESIIQYMKIRNDLPSVFVDAIPEESLTKIIVDKSSFSRLMKKYNIEHPETFSDEEIINNPDLLNRFKRYPYAIKPINTYPFANIYKKKLIEIYNYSDFLLISSDVSNNNIDFIVQDIIPGDLIYIVYFFISREHDLKGFCGYVKTRQYPPDYGVGSFVQTLYNKDVVDELCIFLKKIGYTGIGEAEYKYDSMTGTFRLIEINTRSCTQNRLSAKLGFDAEYYYYLDSLSRSDEIEEKFITVDSVSWIDLELDFGSLYRIRKSKRINIINLLQSYTTIRSFGYFSKDDLMPFIFNTHKYLSFLAKKIFGFGIFKNE